jgi:predicted branched-subunit amino acid permease
MAGASVRPLNFTVRNHLEAQPLSLAAAHTTPSRVRLALTLLWVAWAASACALGVHLYQSRTAPLDLYSALGLPAALAQALLLVLIGRRYNLARLLAVAVAIPGFIVVHVLFPDMYRAATLRINIEGVLRLWALAILLTPEAARWFANGASK